MADAIVDIIFMVIKFRYEFAWFGQAGQWILMLMMSAVLCTVQQVICVISEK